MIKDEVDYFYSGAVLSMIFNQRIESALLVANDDKRQIYDLTINDENYSLYIKHKNNKFMNKTKGCSSWQFFFAQKEIEELKSYINSNIDFSMALVCDIKDLQDSKIEVLDKSEIAKLLRTEKNSVIINEKEKAFI